MGERPKIPQMRTSPIRTLVLAALWICGGCRMHYEDVTQVVASAGSANGGGETPQAGAPSSSPPGLGGTSPGSMAGYGGTRGSGTAGDGGTYEPGEGGSFPHMSGGGKAGTPSSGNTAGGVAGVGQITGGGAGVSGAGSCPCAPGQGCVDAVCVPGKIVFVTSQTVSATFGGIAGADQLCADLAKAANLPGKYQVWLSDSSTSPAARFIKSRIPYALVNGVVVANDWEDLIDGQLAAPINVDERGNWAIAEEVWTSTYADGTATIDHCSDWTSADVSVFAQQGVTDRIDAGWTEIYLQFCDRTTISLLCFEQ